MRNNLIRKLQIFIKYNGFNNVNKVENSILKQICVGKGIDVGCGHRKISDNCIGIDIIGKNEMGKFGCEKDKKSIADIKALGDNLPFKNNELDFIVAKHNLEHYINPDKTVKEWKRVLKKSGKLGVIVPDDRYVNTLSLDKSHCAVFNPFLLAKLLIKNGFKIIHQETAIEKWSICIIGEKV